MDEELSLPNPDRLASLARRFGWMVASLFLFFGLLYLLKDAGFRAAPPAADLRLSDVRFVPEPPYAPALLMEEVRKLGALPEALPSEQGPHFLPLAAALAKHPWVQQVVELRPLRWNEAEIEVVWRVPLLEFAQDGQRFFLSHDRNVLPFRDGVAAKPLRVAGLKLPPKLKGGERLDPPELPQLLALPAALGGDWQAWRLTHLEVHRDPVFPEVRLHTASGSVIIWRSLNGTGQDVPDQEKARRLRAYLKEYGGFEKPNGPYLMDVRPKSGLSRMNLK